MSEALPKVLRVLNGRQAGTEKALPAAGQVSIGHQYWQNVVIRTPETKGTALDLLIDDTGTHLTVLSGEAQLLGSPLGAGQTALLPPYVPFAIGGIALAWGEPDNERWSEAGGLAAAVPAPLLSPPHPGEQALALARRTGTRIGDYLTVRRLLALAAAVVVVTVALFAQPMIDALGLRGTSADRANRALSANGLGMLHAEPDAGTGGVVVTGVAADEAERMRAQQILRNAYLPGTINVQTSDSLAHGAAEVAHAQGLEATARPIDRTRVELHTVPLQPEQRGRLLRGLRSDVPGLTGSVLREDLAPAEDEAIHSVSDVTKKVSTVVAGDPAYVQTADGTRYFPGAIMPTGHRLVAIDAQSILLEKNGQQIRLKF